jgi:hypothetical protein
MKLVIRIETQSDGKRIGTLMAPEMENKKVKDYANPHEYLAAKGLYNLLIEQVDLNDNGVLPHDGDYPKKDFQLMVPMAGVYVDNQPYGMPSARGKDCYRYIKSHNINKAEQ